MIRNNASNRRGGGSLEVSPHKRWESAPSTAGKRPPAMPYDPNKAPTGELGPLQKRVMGALAGRPLTAKALADDLGVMPSSILNATLPGLVRRGLIVRRGDVYGRVE